MKKPAKVKPLFWIIFGVIILILVAAAGSTGPRSEVRADFCPFDWMPVCGILDGKKVTYGNICFLNLAEAEYRSDGECKVFQPFSKFKKSVSFSDFSFEQRVDLFKDNNQDRKKEPVSFSDFSFEQRVDSFKDNNQNGEKEPVSFSDFSFEQRVDPSRDDNQDRKSKSSEFSESETFDEKSGIFGGVLGRLFNRFFGGRTKPPRPQGQCKSFDGRTYEIKCGFLGGVCDNNKDGICEFTF